MLHYSKENYNRLTPYRKHLYNALNFSYVRLTSLKEKEELADIYKSHFNKDSDILNGCGRCLLRDCRTLGKLYFEDEKVYMELEPKTETTEVQAVNNDTIKTATNNEDKPKRGRKKREL